MIRSRQWIHLHTLLNEFPRQCILAFQVNILLQLKTQRYFSSLTKTTFARQWTRKPNKVKVKVKCICIAPHREHISKTFRYGTHSQGISQFYLHTLRSSANGMNHTCLFLPAKAGPHLPTLEGWEAELALVAGTYWNKCPTSTTPQPMKLWLYARTEMYI